MDVIYNAYAIYYYNASLFSEEAKRESKINMIRRKMYRTAKELRKLKVEEMLIFRTSGFDYRIFYNYFLYTLKNKFGKFFGKKMR